MGEKICRHCGATVLVGLEYCPGCLRPVRGPREEVANPVPETRLQSFIASLTSDSTTALGDRSGGAATTSMSDGYTRVVCPKCLRAHRTPLNQSPSALVMCTGCYHQFPASMAAEFRKGADLICFQCGVTTFCVNGLKVNHCPSCKARVTRAHDPERAKLIAFATGVALLLLAGFAYSVGTHTLPQFLVWLCIGSVFTAVGFVVMAALGF